MALTNEFSYANALECANLSSLAYKNEKDFKEAATALGYKNIKFFNVDGAQAYGMSQGDYIVLAFRGTEPTQFNDVKADLNALHVKNELGHGRVHKGFKKEVDDIWNQIEEWISKDKGKSWKQSRDLTPDEKKYPGWLFSNIQPVVRPDNTHVDGMLIFYGFKDHHKPDAKAFLLIEE